MTYRITRQCAKLGCRNLTTGRYCEKHAAQVQQDLQAQRREYDQERRDKEAKAFYNSRPWLTVREFVLRRDNYLCQPCARQNRICFADTVHHVKERRYNPEEELNPEFLESVNHACHNRLRRQHEKTDYDYRDKA